MFLCRNTTQRFCVHFNHFPPLVMSCKTIVKSYNQGIHTDGSRYRTFPSPQVSFALPCYNHIHFFPIHTYSLHPGNHYSAFCFYNFVILRVLHNVIIPYVNFRIGFFTQHNSLEIDLNCCEYQ